LGIGLIIINNFDDILATREAELLGITNSDINDVREFVGSLSILTE
jgi:hypothetical protein